MHFDTLQTGLAGIATAGGLIVFLSALGLYRRRRAHLTATMAWLGLGIALGAGKQFIVSSGSVPWLALLGLSVACMVFASWQLRRHRQAAKLPGAA